MNNKSKNLEKQKQEEKNICTKYFYKRYNFYPQYKEIDIEIPDCYFEMDGEIYAVELTTYFMQNREKREYILKNNIEKYLQSTNFLEQIFLHIKNKKDDITINYKNKNHMFKDIIIAQEYIKYISIGNNYWQIEENNKIFVMVENAANVQNINLIDFIKLLKDKQYNEVKIYLKNSNYYIKLRYSEIYFYQKTDRSIDRTYVWWENDDEKIESLVNAIKNKTDKFEEYYKKMKLQNMNYSKYILIIYPNQYPIDFEQENISKVYESIKSNINNFKYDEIILMLFNMTMVINEKGYKIII